LKEKKQGEQAMTAAQQYNWQEICKRQDLVAGSGVCALVAGEQVALFYLPAEEPPLYALANHDPIGGANVLSRGLVGDIAGRLVVASPLYKQHYDLQTGACLEDDAEQVEVYSVRLEGDSVLIAR
jgi:nitrite reductase (NADH) small subunit